MFELFKQNLASKKVISTLEERIQNLEADIRELDARLLDVEHDSKLLRDKVLRKLQNKSDAENLSAETKNLNSSYSIGKPVKR